MEGRSYPVTRDVDDATRLVAAGVAVSGGGNVQVALVQSGATVAQATTRSVPGWLSILPRITSYNVCYTKLLRGPPATDPAHTRPPPSGSTFTR